VESYEISSYDAGVLANDLDLAAYFESAAATARKPKTVANWILNDLQSALSTAGVPVRACPIPAPALVELVNLIEEGTISGRQGKEVFGEMFTTGKSAAVIVEEKGLKQVSDTGELEKFCDEVIAAHPGPVADYKSGKAAAINFLKGQVMKLSKGKANPNVVGEILAGKLS
jgi:aspartyl-tRNA(Asn)/glutamyl-tRNA(Gln) amidotransferase subunit B